jgi:hypothetical protein
MVSVLSDEQNQQQTSDSTDADASEVVRSVSALYMAQPCEAVWGLGVHGDCGRGMISD